MITINGTEFNCVTSFEFARPKLWADDTGRTYAQGRFKGTLIGIFPKLEVSFKPRSENELQSLIRELDKGNQTVRYYDPKTRGYKTADFYTNDYTNGLHRFLNNQKLWKDFKVSFIRKERD